MMKILYPLIDLFYDVGILGIKGLLAAAVVTLILAALWRTRASKTTLLLLWAVVALRLVCPWSPPSPLSLFNLYDVDEYIVSELDDLGEDSYSGAAGQDSFHGVYRQFEGSEEFDQAVKAGSRPITNEITGRQEVSYTKDTKGNIVPILSAKDVRGMILSSLWLLGMAGLLGYSVVSYLRLKQRLHFAVKDISLPGVWYSDHISSPCVVGVFRPQIYLTFGMSGSETPYVLAHEQQHIKNRDHIWKVLAWLILCIHWFNPLLWIFYRVFLKMVEDACDQRVLRQLGEDRKADYSQALLALSAGRRFRPGPSPIAFGEGDTKSRIRSILRYKKPLVWVTVIAVAAAAVVGVCVFTGPAEPEEEAPIPMQTYTITGVVHQTLFSSVSNDFFLEESKNTILHLSSDLFSVEGDGFVADESIPDPIYSPMDDLNGTIPNRIREDGSSEEIFSIQAPAEARGYRILTADGEETAWHLFECGDSVWLGRWITFGDKVTAHEYSYIIELLPGTLPDDRDPVPTDPQEVASSPAQEEPSYDWEDLVLTWYIPLGADDPTEYGFPLTFSFPFDTFDASCAGGTPYAYNAGTLISGHPIEGANGHRLRWWPYEEGSRDPAKNASITAVAYLEGKEVCACSLLLDLVDITDTELVYSVRATLHGSERFVYMQDQGTFGGEIRENDPESLPSSALAEFSADLTHDGVEETILIYGDYPTGGTAYQGYNVLVRDEAGRGLWSGCVGISHAGQNGIYLYEEDGTHYLMEWCNYGQSGDGSIWYTVFSLTESGKKVIHLQNNFGMEMENPLAVDLAEYEVVNQECIRLLSGSIVLASSNGDTPAWEFYSTPDHILTPILQEEYLMWWTRSDLEAIQAKAQGTYSFRGEVVNTFDDHILVEDQSLWTPDYPYYFYFSIPADDPTQFAMGDKVEVTADGPLYRRDFPDEGTQVTVEKLS